MELLAALSVLVIAVVIWQARAAVKRPRRMSPLQEAREEEWFHSIR